MLTFYRVEMICNIIVLNSICAPVDHRFADPTQFFVDQYMPPGEAMVATWAKGIVMRCTHKVQAYELYYIRMPSLFLTKYLLRELFIYKFI